MFAKTLDASLRQTERDIDSIAQAIRVELEKIHSDAQQVASKGVAMSRPTNPSRRPKKTLVEYLDIRVLFQRLIGVRHAVKLAKQLESLRYGPIAPQDLSGLVANLSERVTSLAGDTEENTWRLANLSGRVAQVDERVPVLSTRVDAIAKDHAGEIAALRGLVETIARRVDDLSRTSTSNVGESEGTGAFNINVDARYRLSHGDMNSRRGAYLSLIKAAADRTGKTTVLDIGGEQFHETLCANGMDGVGIDLQSVRREGGGLAKAEARDCLGSLPSNSVAGVCAFQAVGQVPFEDLIAFLTDACRVLVPGGLLLIETHGGAQFAGSPEWAARDPAPDHPQANEILSFVVKRCGFVDAEFIPLHPGHECADLASMVLQAGNYSLIAWKPL